MDKPQYLAQYFEQSEPLIQIVWITISVLLLIVTYLTIHLKYLRIRLRYNERVEIIYKNKFETDLINYIYSENEEENSNAEQQVIISELKKAATNSNKRKIIIATLIKLRNEISGEVADAIQKLYYKTELISYALSKLNSKKWEVIALGIRELKQFHVTEVQDEVIKHINHPRKEVRDEIQLYLVSLFYFKGLDFLDNFEKTLSEWNQIQLLEILQRFDDQEISDIKPWLNSSNDSVVTFALKLAEIYNQYETKEELIHLLNHQNAEIRVKAIRVLSHLNVVEIKTRLMLSFNNLTLEEQIAFFKMLEYTPDILDVHFISNQINHPNFEIQAIAMSLMKLLNSNSFENLKSKSSDPTLLRIVEFIEKT